MKLVAYFQKFIIIRLQYFFTNFLKRRFSVAKKKSNNDKCGKAKSHFISLSLIPLIFYFK